MGTIEGLGTVAIASRPVVSRPGDRPFTVPAGTAECHAPSTSAVSAGLLGGLLTLQEAGTDAARDGEARRHGAELLDELADLQKALLGAQDAEDLGRLARLVAGVPQAADPRLAGVIRAVALRARLELTRRGM